MGLNERVGLGNRIEISDKITNAKLTIEKKMREMKETLEKKNTTLRKRLQESSQKEFIIDLSKPPEDVELRKDRFAAKFQEIENSGMEINPEN